MKIIFYQSLNQRNYVIDFITRLDKVDRAKILASLKSIEELGFDSPRVEFRQIGGRLWEVKIKAVNAGFRIFYVLLKHEKMILLHAYKKQSQKAPKKEILIAEKRMREVLTYEKDYA